MAATLHSFMDIFDTTFGDGQEAVQIKKIVIPIIQRDYAQGRSNPDVERVRRRFLDSLHNAVTETPITIDFVYGDIDDSGNMTPLDGQQRLTTLFLLHWYAAKKNNIQKEEWQFLKRFSYETRYSARYFCKELVKFMPAFEGILSKEIINQAWFPLDWQKDPTISSMLTMLDDIDNKFNGLDGLWERLKNKSITFYFLPIKDMGLTDELYIKMNSRGKPLTLFEHFKAELEREIRNIDGEAANRIADKIDREWTDLLWEYRNSGRGSDDDNIVDDEFLRYFKFICDVICYRQGESTRGKSTDVFDLLQEYFSSKNPKAKGNIETLESFFDCWLDIPGYDSLCSFFESFMSNEHERDKILVESRCLNILKDCLHNYSEMINSAQRKFPLSRMVLLYAIISYLQNPNKVSSTEDFVRRMRIINNLIRNSMDEISDRSDRNRIPAILMATEAIILTGQIDDTIENSFNVNQLNEEKDKINFLREHPDMADTLFALEDHDLLYGQISILGLNNLSYANRFESLFKCDWDKIDCAMMATGDYGQTTGKNGFYQYGSSEKEYAWTELFHKSANSGFERTREVLVKLLSSNEEFSNAILQQIINGYIADCERDNLYPWRYYYVKHQDYRPGKYGKLSNRTVSTTPYLFSVLQTLSRRSQNAYMPFLKAADDKHLSKDHWGQRLIYGDEYIVCATNNSYERRKNESDEVVDIIIIAQNAEGIDAEDRIIKLGTYIAANFANS